MRVYIYLFFSSLYISGTTDRRSSVVLVLDGEEHKVDVISAVFNPTPDKFKPELFSEIYQILYTGMKNCDKAERRENEKNNFQLNLLWSNNVCIFLSKGF